MEGCSETRMGHSTLYHGGELIVIGEFVRTILLEQSLLKFPIESAGQQNDFIKG